MAERPAVTTYLVTGGGGFLGRYVIDELRNSGAENIVVPRRSQYDLTRQHVAEQLVESVQPDVVLHLAAEVGGIGANRENPGRYFYANVIMGVNLIEAARASNVAKFVQVGTVCSYPKHTTVPFVEDDLWDGFPDETNAPYGVAKRSLLTMLMAYRIQYEFNGIYLLPANLYGPHDNFDPESSHVIPALVRRFVDARTTGAKSVTLWGTGSPSREFLYVRDAARGIVIATLDYDSPEPVNLGTGIETTIARLAQQIAQLAGYNGNILWDDTKPDGQPRRALDVSRSQREFGFATETTLEDGLRETITWWEEQQGIDA